MMNHPHSRLAEKMPYYIADDSVASDQGLVTSGEAATNHSSLATNHSSNHSPLATNHLQNDQELVNSEGGIEDGEELQRFDRLAEGNGLSGNGVSSHETIPERGTVRVDQSSTQSSRVRPVQHSGGASPSINSGIQEFSVHSTGIPGGSGNTIVDRSASGLPYPRTNDTNHDSPSGNQQNAPSTPEKTNHQPLATNHFQFHPVENNVLPILDEGWFAEDITERFQQFLRVTFGEEHYEENLTFLENAIGKDLRKYFLKDFYNDHVKRYKKRPIYWCFSSPDGSFNALIYLHRYRPDTVSVVLNDYLREFRTKLTARREHQAQISISASASQSEKTKALKEIEKLKKTIDELETYEREILYPLATQQIKIDLDDGVKFNYNKFGKALKKIPGLSEK